MSSIKELDFAVNDRFKDDQGKVIPVYMDDEFQLIIHAGAGLHSLKNEHKYKVLLEEVIRKSRKFTKELLSTNTNNKKRKRERNSECYKGPIAVQVVKYSIGLLERDSLTNAGVSGCNMTIEGTVECDACLMDDDGVSGAIGAVPMIGGISLPLDSPNLNPSPIDMAFSVYLGQKEGCLGLAGRQPPFLLTGLEAHNYSFPSSLDMKDFSPASSMLTGKDILDLIEPNQILRYHSHLAVLNDAKEREGIPSIKRGERKGFVEKEVIDGENDSFQDTVGAVCFVNGRMAAGVSSGGISLKICGRIGEAAIEGSGVACTKSEDGIFVGVSVSGNGEQIMATQLARHVEDSLLTEGGPESIMSNLKAAISSKFINAKRLKSSLEKNMGCVILRKEEGNPPEILYGHTTPSLALAFSSGTNGSKFMMSRKAADNSICIGCASG